LRLLGLGSHGVQYCSDTKKMILIVDCELYLA
jgi:hypothetical protein